MIKQVVVFAIASVLSFQLSASEYHPPQSYKYVSMTGAKGGVKSNGFKFNGIRTNGLQFNGIRFNGVKMNGKRLNGLQWNGRRFNGVSINTDNTNGVILANVPSQELSRKPLGK